MHNTLLAKMSLSVPKSSRRVFCGKEKKNKTWLQEKDMKVIKGRKVFLFLDFHPLESKKNIWKSHQQLLFFFLVS